MSKQHQVSRRFLILTAVLLVAVFINFRKSQDLIYLFSNQSFFEIPTLFNETNPFTKDLCHETTVVVTSSYIPITPSLRIINGTIQSLHHLRGLCPTSPIIITVDGLSRKILWNFKKSKIRMEQYIQALRNTYKADHYTILANNRSLGITGNVKAAMDIVQTDFVYVIQHDLPFIHDINHSAVIKTMREYPDVLRLVRFNLRPNVVRQLGGTTESDVSCYNSTSPMSDVNGIHFIKTWIWSDNNHVTRKSYYEEMFQLLYKQEGELPFAMEWVMRGVGKQNCSYWGPFYYGPYGFPSTIGHLDGKQTIERRRRHL